MSPRALRFLLLLTGVQTLYLLIALMVVNSEGRPGPADLIETALKIGVGFMVTTFLVIGFAALAAQQERRVSEQAERRDRMRGTASSPEVTID